MGTERGDNIKVEELRKLQRYTKIELASKMGISDALYNYKAKVDNWLPEDIIKLYSIFHKPITIECDGQKYDFIIRKNNK